jgi:hypothetical protein
MRVVRILRNMRPWRAGQDAVLSDELAAKLIAAGDAEDSRPYPPPDVAPRVAVAAPLPPTKGRYMTRKRGF